MNNCKFEATVYYLHECQDYESTILHLPFKRKSTEAKKLSSLPIDCTLFNDHPSVVNILLIKVSDQHYTSKWYLWQPKHCNMASTLFRLMCPNQEALQGRHGEYQIRTDFIRFVMYGLNIPNFNVTTCIISMVDRWKTWRVPDTVGLYLVRYVWLAY